MRLRMEWGLLSTIENIFGTLDRSVEELEVISLELPIIAELIGIPTPFLKSSTVDSPNSFVYTGYADFIGTKPDNVSMLAMCSMDRLVFFFFISLP